VLNRWGLQPREPSPHRFLLVRALVGVAAAGVVWLQGDGAGAPSIWLTGWLLTSSLVVRLLWQGRGWTDGLLAFALFGDCIAVAATVRATGSLQSPTLLLLTLPVLAGGLLFFWRVGLILGLITALFYGLMAWEQALRGGIPAEFWSLVTFHTLLFTCMGLAAGVLARRMASTLREAAETRSELEAVRLSTDRIIETLTCGLIAMEGTGEVRSLNPEACRLLGLPPGARRIPPAVAEENPALWGMLEAGRRGSPEVGDAEIMVRGADGRAFPAWVKVTPVRTDGGATHGLVALFWDLTERKELEARARQRDRLAAVGELSAGLAHEIRNSLKPITGSIELLQGRVEVPESVRPLMELITREAASLEAFLSQFLALARDKTLKLEEIDLEDLIGDEVRALQVGRSWGERKVSIATTESCRLQGDRGWLRQVFRNLLLNALEASPGGDIAVQLEQFQREGRPWLRTRILDRGPGLEGVEEHEAFLPFRTTKAGGSGLGLPIAQRGVEEHGGTIAFDKTASDGGCIVVELPESGKVTPGNKHAA